MALDCKAEAIDQLEWHWNTQLRKRLDGLTDDEFFWEPVKGCWTMHRREELRTPMQFGPGEMVLDFEVPEPNPTPITTIAWRLAHIGTCFEVRTVDHFGAGYPQPWWDHMTYPASAAKMLAHTDEWCDRWLNGIRSLSDERLAAPVGPAEGQWHEKPYLALILHINREIIHHGAEIALLRDLYRAQ